MRGTIAYINDNYGYIKPFDSKQKLSFNPNCLLNLEWDELLVGMIVDFADVSDDTSKTATYIRKSPLVWLYGNIESINITPWGEKQFNIATDLGNRTFWFLESNTLIENDTMNFCVGDSVGFQCEGYYKRRNQAYNVTKQKLGYITNFDVKNESGLIDYTLHFTKDKIINFDEFHIDSTKYFYLVTYGLVNDLVQSITIVNQIKEIIFDDEDHWIDGSVERINTSNVGNEYMIIAPRNGAACKIKSSFDAFDKYCDPKWLLPEHHISYSIDDEQNVKEIMWTGYITRFPSNPTTKDLSARINSYLWTNEYEENTGNLIYFRKNKIINHQSDEQQKNFWIDARIFDNIRRIPIKTYDQRFKVRYALTEDKDYGIKAIKVKVIGVAKAPNQNMGSSTDIDVIPQNVTINNYYAPVYQQFNFVQNILQMDSENLISYLQKIFNKNNIGNAAYDEAVFDTISTELMEASSLEDENFSSYERTYREAIEAFSQSSINLEISKLPIERLSEKCIMYLKTAVIVDYRLMGEVCMLSDLSAQSVFYGKFVEQLLKDILYPIFKSDIKLADKLTKLSPNGVETVTSSTQTTIGTYWNAIKRNVGLISEVCSNNYSLHTVQDWNRYWCSLNEKLFAAKDIRNKTDHAASLVNIQDVDKMRTLILANDGIINKIQLSISYLETIIEKQSSTRFKYERNLYGKNNNINGLIGRVQEKPALLHIKQLCNRYISQEEIKSFIHKIKDSSFTVRLLAETDKGVEVTLLDVTPSFDELIK